jgi:hypothetical protein
MMASPDHVESAAESPSVRGAVIEPQTMLSANGGLVLLAGIVILCAVCALSGWRAASSGIRDLGWTVMPLALLHTLPILLDSRGWLALLLIVRSRVSAARVWGIALVREAIASNFPFSGIGAFLVGVRLLFLRGVSASEAVSSITAESTIGLTTQFSLMLAGGLAWTSIAGSSTTVRLHQVLCLLAAAAGLGGVIALQRHIGFLRLVQRGLRRLSSMPQAAQASETLNAIYQSLDRIYAAPSACIRCAGWQLTALTAGVGELWLLLVLLQVPHACAVALSLSGISRLTRSAAFVVPAGLGIQEAAYGALFLSGGLHFDMGVAVSMATRARDLVFSVPAVLIWTYLEKTGNAACPDNRTVAAP